MGIVKVEKSLREGQKVHEILQGMQRTPTAFHAAQGEKDSLRCRATAVCLTIGDLLGQRKAEQDKEAFKKRQKEENKRQKIAKKIQDRQKEKE